MIKSPSVGNETTSTMHVTKQNFEPLKYDCVHNDLVPFFQFCFSMASAFHISRQVVAHLNSWHIHDQRHIKELKSNKWHSRSDFLFYTMMGWSSGPRTPLGPLSCIG